MAAVGRLFFFLWKEGRKEAPQVPTQLLALHPESRLVLGEDLLPHVAPGHTLAKVQPPAGSTLFFRHVVVFGGGYEELDNQDRLDRVVLELLPGTDSSW